MENLQSLMSKRIEEVMAKKTPGSNGITGE